MALIYKPVFKCDFCGKEIEVDKDFEKPKVTISINIDTSDLDPRFNLAPYMEKYIEKRFGFAEGEICGECAKAITERIIYRRTHINDKG
ncbi:MAG: hypothetical protein IJI83_03595 [Oscillospiraceae bacterium]|nr:hypothetical protein [Oscillospiraceae bacterium]